MLKKALLVGMLLFQMNIYSKDYKIVTKKDGQLNWYEAHLFCKNLNYLNKQWRLLTFEELKQQTSIEEANLLAKEDYFWSSTTNREDNDEAYIFNFLNQLSCEGVKNSDLYYVMCIEQSQD